MFKGFGGLLKRVGCGVEVEFDHVIGLGDFHPGLSTVSRNRETNIPFCVFGGKWVLLHSSMLT